MRTHQQIVRDFGATALGRALAAMGMPVSASTPQRWADRDSVPSEYWAALVELRAATLDELARAADLRGTSGVGEDGEAFKHPQLKTSLIFPPLARTPEARRAALESLLAMAGEGYGSNGWKFNRDELYDRDDR